MLERERPDIVSVATQPEQRAAIVIHACEHGARAIYAEKRKPARRTATCSPNAPSLTTVTAGWYGASILSNPVEAGWSIDRVSSHSNGMA